MISQISPDGSELLPEGESEECTGERCFKAGNFKLRYIIFLPFLVGVVNSSAFCTQLLLIQRVAVFKFQFDPKTWLLFDVAALFLSSMHVIEQLKTIHQNECNIVNLVWLEREISED